jgi:hypothetical protein
MELRANSLRRAQALLALATAGCMVVDGRPEVRLSPPGPIYTTGEVTLRVDAPRATVARIAVDGTDTGGTYPVGTDFTFFLARDFALNVRHRIVARVYYGTLSSDSKPVDVVVDSRPATFTVSPPGGIYVSTAPFVVTLDFDEPLDPVSVSPATVRLERVAAVWPPAPPAPEEPVPATVTLSPDRQRIVLAAASPLTDLGDVELVTQVRDNVGFLTWSRGPRWHAPSLGVHLLMPFPVVGGVIVLTGQWSTGAPERVNVLVDGSLIGQMRRDGSLPWDTRLWIDGEHEVRLDIPGYVPTVSQRVTVDNTPPHVLSCTPQFTAPDDASVRDSVAVVFSECVCQWQRCYPARCDPLLVSPPLDLAVPSAYRFTFAGVMDAAGNDVPPWESCSVDYPAWRKPWGTSALVWEGMASPVDLRFLLARILPDVADFLYIGPAPASGPASVRRVGSQAPGPWTLDPSPLNTNSLGPVPELRTTYGTAVWVEAENDGSWTIRHWGGQGTPGFGPSVTIARLAGPLELARLQSGEGLFGWVETSGTGVRQVRAALGTDPVGAWVVSPPANVASDADAGAPSLTQSPEVVVAFVETPPGGVAQLRVRRWEGGATGQWVSLGDVLNRDPGLPASEPSVGWNGFISVAWVEGNRVLARRMGAAGTWSPPEELNADPGNPARSPRLMGADYLAFVESGPGADRFEMRRWVWSDWTTGAWRALTPLPATGQVAAWDARWPMAVVWTDTSGGPYLRVYNQ